MSPLLEKNSLPHFAIMSKPQGHQRVLALKHCCLFLWCILLIWLGPSAFASLAEPAIWADRGPYRWVGDPGDGDKVKLPAPVVNALRHFVSDDPSHWSISKVDDFPGRKKHLLQVTSGTKGYANLILDSGFWINLSAQENASLLNKVLEQLQPSDIWNHKKLERYVYQIVYLQKHGFFKFLTPELKRERFTTDRIIDKMNVSAKDRQALLAGDLSLKEAQIDTWLEGTEKSRKVLLALFHDLEVNKIGDHVMIRGNVMSYLGAVEHWTFHLRVDQTVRLESTDVREIYKEGTFSFPLTL